jgi:hypothetical protein
VIVSQDQNRERSPEREAAVDWLRHQIAWEQVLGRLRREAGVDAGASAGLPRAA